MNDMTISSNNINPHYPLPPPQVVTSTEESAAPVATTGQINIEDLINQDPKLKELFTKMVESTDDKSKAEVFNIYRVIASLIELNKILQGAAITLSDRLGKITEKLTGYTKLQTQVPVVIKGTGVYEGDDDRARGERADANQKFANMLEAIRANKGLDEDKAKKIQTLMQSMKDAGTSTSDFVSSFIDLLRSIGTRINQ